MRGRLALLVAVLLCPSVVAAQSTPFGKILYAPDRAWTWALRQWPALAEIDRTEERSAASTGVIVALGGYGLSKVTPMSYRRGRQVVAAVYVLRSVYGITSGETNRYRAHAKHVVVATAVATVQLRVRVRF